MLSGSRGHLCIFRATNEDEEGSVKVLSETRMMDGALVLETFAFVKKL